MVNKINIYCCQLEANFAILATLRAMVTSFVVLKPTDVHVQQTRSKWEMTAVTYCVNHVFYLNKCYVVLRILIPIPNVYLNYYPSLTSSMNI